MKTSIKILLLKAITYITSIVMMIFGVGSGIVIFTRSAEIILHMPYTKAEASAIIVGIGIALIWLIVLLAESAEWITKAGFKKAENI